jgi:C-terminal processing protease CtpA/Prc
MGIHFTQLPPGTPPEDMKFTVSYIDPAGPAAKTDLKVGDVIISIDGTDITGTHAGDAYNLMQAPPGTAMKLGLARGTTVAIVLAAP